MNLRHTGGAQLRSRWNELVETPPVLGKETSSAVRSCTTWHSRHWRPLYRRLGDTLAHSEGGSKWAVELFFAELFRALYRGGAIYTLGPTCGIDGEAPRSHGEARKGRDSI